MTVGNTTQKRRWTPLFSKSIKWFMIVMVMGMAGYYFATREATTSNMEMRNTSQEVSAAAQSVGGFLVERGPIEAWVFSDGTARSVRREYLTFERSGKISFIKKGSSGRELRQGDQVEAGEVLARIDARRYQRDIETAEAALEEARTQHLAAAADVKKANAQHKLSRAQFNRTQSLAQSRAISKSELEQAEAELENTEAAKVAALANQKSLLSGITSAESKLAQAKLTLEETVLITPIDGIVAYLNIEEGYYFTQNMLKTNSESDALQSIPIIVIDPTEYEITVDIPAFEAARVNVGQGVLLTPGGLAATSVFESGSRPIATQSNSARGTVYSVNPAVNPGGRSVQIVIRSTQGAALLRDGMYTSCWIQVEQRSDAIVAPFEAFLFEENQPYVFVIDHSSNRKTQVARRQPVQIGIQGLESREISAGVEAGELIATEGRYRLVDGAPVHVVNQEGERDREGMFNQQTTDKRQTANSQPLPGGANQ